MSPPISRRGILRGTLGGTVLASEGCGHKELVSERAPLSEPPPPGATPAAATSRLEFTVNGLAKSLDVEDADVTALELVRNQLALTGCKESCGHGACGACTILLDDAPVVSCLLPAVALHRRRLTTIEGLAPAGELHPVQRAFMAEDALQCGFCTPGFVVAASAFYRDWRAAHANTEPDRDTVAAALSGNLCRCAAYDGIINAVQKASAGKYEKPLGAETPPPRHDAREKVTGAAKYTVDVRIPGQLEGKILRSPHAHAKVRKVDWTAALKIPGVEGAVDLLNGSTTLRFAGQEILAIAAVDARTAEAALAAVVLDLEVLPAVVGMDAGRAPGAAPVYPSRNTRKAAPNASEGPLLPVGWDGNLRGPFQLFSTAKLKARNAVAHLRKEPADGVLVEGTWRTQVQCHSSHEPHACVAHFTAPDAVTVHLSTQAVNAVADDIAERWDLKRANVRVLVPYVGGGFGAKATLQLECVAAIELAKVTGKPVRVVLERREELITGGTRPAQEIELAVATDRDGYLKGVTAKAMSDAGCAVGSTSTVMLRLMYANAPKDIADWDVLNHAPPGKPFRGPGGPPIFWALEQAVDVAADRLKLDPILLRKRLRVPNPARNMLYDWALTLKTWRERQPARSDRGRFQRGLGLAVAGWFYFVQPSARVQIDAGPHGISVSTACQDIGNGTRTVLAEAVARVLGIAPSDIEVKIGDSSYVTGPMSGGSRTTASILPAATMAAEELRDELLERAAIQVGARGVAVPGGVRHAGGVLAWKTILAGSPPLRFVGTRKRDKGGYFLPPMFDIAPGKYVSGALQIAEVEVDTRLGKIRVLHAHTGVAAGHIVSPVLARSQVLGGVIQGIGFALYEERRLDPKTGIQLTGGLEDYRIPGIGDIGRLEVDFIEDGYDRVNGRSVGLAELVTLAPAAAIGNAVAHATGWRPRELPLRPDRVLQGVPRMIELPNTLDAALGRPGEPRAGGTDITERRKLHLSKGTVIDLRDVPGLDTITWRNGQLHVGALVTLAALAAHPEVRRHYPAIAQTAEFVATPQIRARATLGGNLLQHVRCWYYRRPGADCLRAGGSACQARTGDHLFHVCFDRGPCAAPHPSSMATALLAHDVKIEVAGDREHTLATLYGDASDPRRQHLLPEGAVLTGVALGPPLAGERAAYVRSTSRARAEWPLVEVVARLVTDGETVRSAAVTIGGVANLPLRLAAVEQLLAGKPSTPENLAAAAALASDGAKPLPGTTYKLELVRGAVLEALERALSQTPTPPAPTPSAPPTSPPAPTAP